MKTLLLGRSNITNMRLVLSIFYKFYNFISFRFLADYRDLCSWINDMKAVISADELAKDVAGAEALLESHQEHRVIY